MSWSTPLDAYVPVALSRADYDATRRKFYRVTQAPRDDERWPVLVPPGARYAPSAFRPEFDWVVPESAVARASLDGYQQEFVIPAPVVEVGVCAGPMTGVYHLFGQPVEFAFVGVERGVSRDACEKRGGAWHSEKERTGLDQPVTRDWWYDTPWGREVVVTLVPPLVLGQYGWEPVEMTPIPTDNPDIPPLVAVPYPHPYIVGGAPPLFVVEIGTSSGEGDSGHLTQRPFGIYESPVVLTGRGDRHEARFVSRNYDPDLAALPASVKGVWLGFYEDAESSEWYEDALNEVASTVARSAALSILTQIVGTYITAGGATALLQAALQQAAGQVQTVGTTGTTIAPTGASVAQTGAVDAGSLVPTGAQGSQTVIESSGIIPSTPAATLNPLDIARQAPELTASVVAPEQTNKALAVAAEASVYLDAMGSTQQLWNMTMRELTIRAQRTREGADELRLRLAALEQEVHGQTWFVVTQNTVNAVMAIAAASNLASGSLAAALVALTRLGVSASSMALQLLNATEAARAMRERLEEEARQRARDAFLQIPTTSIAEPAPVAPAAGDGKGFWFALAAVAAVAAAWWAGRRR